MGENCPTNFTTIIIKMTQQIAWSNTTKAVQVTQMVMKKMRAIQATQMVTKKTRAIPEHHSKQKVKNNTYMMVMN